MISCGFYIILFCPLGFASGLQELDIQFIRFCCRRELDPVLVSWVLKFTETLADSAVVRLALVGAVESTMTERVD